jgi:protein ImuB
MSLWLCLRFSQLPLQALTRQQTDKQLSTTAPAAVVIEAPAAVVIEAQRVIGACDDASALGIKPGMGTATVRALAENVQLLERDTLKEQQCLQQLSCWAYSITPNLFPWRDNSLILEVGSCLSLFRGLENLLNRIRADLSLRNYSYTVGLAPTPKAAWLLSHVEQSDYQLPLKQQLAPLPLNLLTDFSRQTDSLAKAGLWHFGDIMELSQQALGRRCGKEFVQFLRQVLGTSYDEQPDFQPPPQFSDHYWFGYEVKANQELLPATQLLLQSLCNFLRNTQLQCQRIEWKFYGVQNNNFKLPVHCSKPQANWREWYRLTDLKIEQMQLKSGVEGLGLSCMDLCEGNYRSQDLFSTGEQKEPLHSLLDRLQNRLGLQAVEKIASRNEHLPEYASYSSCQLENLSNQNTAAAGQRPFWLMPEPQPLGGHREHLHWNGKLKLLAGPERIEDNWWLDPVSRDYYVARNKSGQLYWLYRDRLQQQWFIHGVFA